MELIKGTKIHGFTVKEIRNSKKAGTSYELSHDKTGAKLIWMDNKQENMLFSVTFKTVPENSTGVFHILEHSVLCGSEKYPVREPFLELMKGSMNTFLNAMTYPDKTVYPISSRNEKDFFNLMGIYLDAVFSPLLTKESKMFMQEGIHLESNGGEPFFNGVVFNEMKGAMSSVDDRIEEETGALLFPDSCYRFNSGGDPKEIVNLTYEKYLATYKKFYHPSNSRFYLDGNLPIEKTLKAIDEYISKYEKLDSFPKIAKQIPVRAKKTTYFGTNEADGDKDILCFAKIIGTFDDVKKLFATQIIADYLTSSNDAPLKRAILSAEIAEDIELSIMDGIYQPYAQLVLRNMDSNNADKAKNIIKELIESTIKAGIPKAELTAALNKLEFSYRETPEPQAIYRGSSVFSSWLYDGDPMLYLDLDGVFRELRSMIETDGYEKLLSDLFLNTEGLAELTMLPSLELVEKEAAEEKALAEKTYASLTAEQKEKLEKDNEILFAWQKTPDTKEALDTIPLLSISDVNPKPKQLSTDELTVGDTKLLYHKANTNGITYISMYIPLADFELSELTDISVLSLFYKELPTTLHSLNDLQREINTYIGSLRFTIASYAERGNLEEASPYIVVRASVLNDNLIKAEELMAEVLLKTDMSDKSKFTELIKQYDDINKQSAVSSGHTIGINSVLAGYSSLGAVKEAMNGYTFMHRIHSIALNTDAEFDKLNVLFKKLNSAINRSSVIISVTSENLYEPKKLIELLSDGNKSKTKSNYASNIKERTAVKIPGAVSYAVKGYNHRKCGKTLDGSFYVASNVVSLSYLWNKVRVQGGAYGTGLSVFNDEGFICYSYRDPSPSESLKTYDKAGDFLREFVSSGEALDKYIISAVSGNDPLISPQMEGALADRFYLSGISYESRIKTRTEMLNTSSDDLLGWAETLGKMAESGRICIVGNEKALMTINDIEIKEI